ncbi:SDR family NAD(P)-dependent oxidoreductase [Sphingobium subterraneum]|uniref:Short-chain dehydrogenase/reductase SDR n=1 Tax=Sphingobium subterraneum TaxID=627688 RepID=A0A841IYB8_9SPHN|nr:SDR family oxidoreductase [Sphingobium subterraneum]MBB6123404.1 hypothetical protein [Sphingobium subterraneum]
MTSSRLAGKTAIVTGGGTGIGRAIAQLFAQEGAEVVVAGRTAAALQQTVEPFGGYVQLCDVTQEAQVDALFADTQKRFGRIDILINNAGASGPVSPLTSVDMGEWRDCIELNLFGALYCMRAAARIMSAQKSGSIVNMSSLMGLKGYPMRTAYCATKFAIIGITEALAREVGPDGVRVNALCPGAISGELMDRVIARRSEAEGKPPEQIIWENYTSVAALQRWVSPEEVAEAALFLASDASASITGDRLKVDAGRF